MFSASPSNSHYLCIDNRETRIYDELRATI